MKKLVVFTEEMSAKAMLESLLPRLLPSETCSFFCIAFEGKQDLEKQLPIKLKAWRAPNTHFLVLRDQDSGDCKKIKQNLQAICKRARKPQTLVRIVCRELENWYFGDLEAVEIGLQINGLSAFQKKAKYRTPDKIQNPKKELEKLTKNRYQQVSGSRIIGKHLQLDANRSSSKSFRHFIRGVHKIVG